ncbi:MAG: superoxide dismutase, partial [Rikenellaceae bacterium]|nr:superoxide dismutase [Rikenellaceae bacterium]
MKHEMPQLPYEQHALEPYMSAETLEYHYGKHLQAHINNLNNLIQGTKYEEVSLETIIKEADGPVFNNGAQVWNHTLFFLSLSPSARKTPQGELAAAIDRDFGSFDQFKEEFTTAAAAIFGSGWAWLACDHEGKLTITKESNAGNPMQHGRKPLMTCDVWEHAYYIDYRNRRPD